MHACPPVNQNLARRSGRLAKRQKLSAMTAALGLELAHVLLVYAAHVACASYRARGTGDRPASFIRAHAETTVARVALALKGALGVGCALLLAALGGRLLGGGGAGTGGLAVGRWGSGAAAADPYMRILKILKVLTESQ